MITFKVDDVKQNKFLPNSTFDKNNLNNLIGLGIESSSISDDQYISPTNNLLAAINTAYDQHLPLVLSPDMIWLAIAQGLSLHIMNNAEELRHQFVNFEGKKEIIVYENSFIKGKNNNWEGTFSTFSEEIKEYIGKKRDLIVGDYSTTTNVTRAANEIVLMESMSNYFDYKVVTMCGIPEITILGTIDDWKSIKNRVQAMSEFNLSWWTNVIEPVIDEFISAINGSPNVSFWKDIFKERDSSGGPYFSGWITNFFPYLMNFSTEKFDIQNKFKFSPFMDGLTTSRTPNGMSKVPFKWDYYGQIFNMELIAGFDGFKINESGAVVPNIGWAVRDTNC